MSDTKRFDNITDAEMKAKGVVSLALRPNMPSQYGQGGLTGKQLQERFDRLARYIVEKYNILVDGLASHDVLDYFKLPEGYSLDSLNELVERISDSHGDLVVKSPYTEKYEKVADILAQMKLEILNGTGIIDVDALPTTDIVPTIIYRYEGILYHYDETDKAWRIFADTSYVDEKLQSELSKYVQAYIGKKGTININQASTQIVYLEYDGWNGGIAHLSTEQTFTRNQLVGGTATINNNYGGDPKTIAITSSMITEETEDGICVVLGTQNKYAVKCIISAYTTNYQPSIATTPCPAVGTYLSYWYYYDAEWVESINVEVVPTKYINNALIDLRGHPDYPSIPETPSTPTEATKLYKHNVYINSGNIGAYFNEAKIRVSYTSTSPTPITTLAELSNSPAVVEGTYGTKYLNYAYANYDYADEQNGTRDVSHISLTVSNMTIYYVTAYTVPTTLSYATHKANQVVITDTVMEV